MQEYDGNFVTCCHLLEQEVVDPGVVVDDAVELVVGSRLVHGSHLVDPLLAREVALDPLQKFLKGISLTLH